MDIGKMGVMGPIFSVLQLVQFIIPINPFLNLLWTSYIKKKKN